MVTKTELQAQLDTQERQLRAVLDALPANVAVLDSNGMVVAVNRGWCLFAAENGANTAVIQGVGINYLEVCRWSEKSGDHAAGLAADGIESVLDGRKNQFTLEYRCDLTYEARWFAMSVTSLGTSPPQGAVVVHLDITSRRQLEMELSLQREAVAQESRLYSISELASGITHEITQPLTAIGYYCEALQMALESPMGKIDTTVSLVKRIRNQTLRAMDVVSHLRAFMRRLHPNLTVLSVNALLYHATCLVENRARDRKCRLHLSVPDELPPVIGDATQLKQVLMHLLNNAIEATVSASGQEPLVSLMADHDPDWVRISVQDNGPGMDTALARDIFKVMKTGTANRLGLGLGISLSIVNAHGGRLWLDTTYTQGSCFHFTLPVAGGHHEV